MTPPEERASATGERRRSSRRSSDIDLHIAIDADAIRGRAENISQAGVFFFSGDSLRVTVRIEGDSQSYSGRIVRVERLSDDSTGFAIEFDRQ